MTVEVRKCCCRAPSGRRRVGSVVLVDGIEYAHEHGIDARGGGLARAEAELLRTAKRWQKSEHGDFLVLKEGR